MSNKGFHSNFHLKWALNDAPEISVTSIHRNFLSLAWWLWGESVPGQLVACESTEGLRLHHSRGQNETDGLCQRFPRPILHVSQAVRKLCTFITDFQCIIRLYRDDDIFIKRHLGWIRRPITPAWKLFVRTSIWMALTTWRNLSWASEPNWPGAMPLDASAAFNGTSCRFLS